MKIIKIKTTKRTQAIDVTSLIREEIKKSSINNGICFIYVPHTTSAITINENYDESVMEDLFRRLEELIPKNRNYKHIEGNADAHIKASLIGNSVVSFIENGKLLLGRWQGIVFLEFDGPRNRELWFKILKV